MTIDWSKLDREILAGLDIASEAEALGVRFSSSKPSANGWLECYAINRDEQNASAAVCVKSSNGQLGKYTDLGNTEQAISLFELAAKLKKLPDWQEARKHYAEKAGVELPTKQKSTAREKVVWRPEFLTDFIDVWCQNKSGMVPEQVKRSRVSCGRFPASAPATLQQRVLAFFAYRPDDWEHESTILLYRIDGKDFPAFKSKSGKQAKARKCHMVGSDENKDGLIIIGSREDFEAAHIVWFVEGLTCALSIAPFLPAGHIAVTSVHGANSFDAGLAEAFRKQQGYSNSR